MTGDNNFKNRNYSKIVQFFFFFLVILIFFYDSLRELISFSFSPGPYSLKIYSYISLVPLVSIYFIFERREKIFSKIIYSLASGIAVIITGLAIYLLGIQWKYLLFLNDFLSLMTIAFLVLFTGVFIFFFGKKAFQVDII
jgi:hypothetical protein